MSDTALWRLLACCSLTPSALVLAAATIGARESRPGRPHPNHQKTKEPTP